MPRNMYIIRFYFMRLRPAGVNFLHPDARFIYVNVCISPLNAKKKQKDYANQFNLCFRWVGDHFAISNFFDTLGGVHRSSNFV